MTNFTESDIEILLILVNSELDNEDRFCDSRELHIVRDKLLKLNHEQSRAMSFAKATIAVRIDKTIHNIIRTEFTNAYALRKLSVQSLVEAYDKHGQHKIDFTKIYDLDE